MNVQNSSLQWNRLFISVSLKIGKIYFQTSDMNLTLFSAHSEERWQWVDESFVKKATEIYIWLLNNPKEENTALSCSFEYLLSHVQDTPSSPLIPKLTESEYLKKYLGADYDNFFSYSS